MFSFQRCGFFFSLDGGNLDTLPNKALFGAVYLPSYILLTVCATLVVIHMYISRLERYVPQPIFMDYQRLLRVVVESVIETVNLEFMNSPDASIAEWLEADLRCPGDSRATKKTAVLICYYASASVCVIPMRSGRMTGRMGRAVLARQGRSLGARADRETGIEGSVPGE